MVLPAMADWNVERTHDLELRLSGTLTFADITAIRKTVDQRLDEMSGEISIDFSGVNRVDSSALSLWLCILRRAESLGLKLKPVNVPADMLSIADLVGLEQCFS